MKTIETKIQSALTNHKPKLTIAEKKVGAKITRSIVEALLPTAQKKVYDALTFESQPVKAIAEKSGYPSKFVAAILIAISQKTTLVNFERIGKNKLWYKSAPKK